MNRSKIRETVFKLLFRAEFNDLSEMPEQTGLFFELEDKVDEHPVSDTDQEYIKARETAILDKLPEIDRLINEKAEGWSTSRMGKTELAIIRLAVYEILFDDDIPVSVAINEAVELAKKYGQDNSGTFVNGVLAKFAK
ncbi:MAG: transcription antitermination factor NusB [Lachnospiraceae bacterium]|nr:transcription antitermination factor NusB [Lachnospiraceae bacterium]